MTQLIMLAIAFVAVVGTITGAAYKVHHAGYLEGSAEVKQQWDAASKAARQREAEASAAAAAALTEERQRRKTKTLERKVYVDKIVEHPVYRNVCFDADGMRCLGAAIRGESAAGCKPSQ